MKPRFLSACCFPQCCSTSSRTSRTWSQIMKNSFPASAMASPGEQKCMRRGSEFRTLRKFSARGRENTLPSLELLAWAGELRLGCWLLPIKCKLLPAVQQLSVFALFPPTSSHTGFTSSLIGRISFHIYWTTSQINLISSQTGWISSSVLRIPQSTASSVRVACHMAYTLCQTRSTFIQRNFTSSQVAWTSWQTEYISS